MVLLLLFNVFAVAFCCIVVYGDFRDEKFLQGDAIDKPGLVLTVGAFLTASGIYYGFNASRVDRHEK